MAAVHEVSSPMSCHVAPNGSRLAVKRLEGLTNHRPRRAYVYSKQCTTAVDARMACRPSTATHTIGPEHKKTQARSKYFSLRCAAMCASAISRVGTQVRSPTSANPRDSKRDKMCPTRRRSTASGFSLFRVRVHRLNLSRTVLEFVRLCRRRSSRRAQNAV